MSVPAISSGELKIYGNKEKIKIKVESVVEYLSGLRGNLLIGGVLGEVFSFNCYICGTSLKKPIKYLSSPAIVNCINPECNESYFLEPNSKEQEFKITRRILIFSCKSCNGDLNVPANVFKELKFDQRLNIRCGSCGASLTVIMRPLIEENVE